MSVSEPQQQTKTVVITALISAVSTIAVSLIAIQPSLPKPVPHPGWSISGRVKDADGKPVSAQLYLLKPESTKQTDDRGKFLFDQVPQAPYSILVEVGDSKGEHSNRYQVSTTDSEDPRPLAGGRTIQLRMEKAPHE